MEKIPQFWLDNSRVKSIFFDSGSVAIPEAERFLVVAVHRVLDKYKVKESEEIRRLLLEEENHSSVHDFYNAHLERYYRIHTLVRLERFQTAFFQRLLSAKQCLAIGVCIEHFTAILSRALPAYFEDRSVHNKLREVWLWHSYEELDHRDIAFDLYKEIGGGYFRRIVTMALSTFIFMFNRVLATTFLMHQSRDLYSLKSHRELRKFLWGKDGFYRKCFKEYLMFYRPSFHPSQIDISELEEKVKYYDLKDTFIDYFK